MALTQKSAFAKEPGARGAIHLLLHPQHPLIFDKVVSRDEATVCETILSKKIVLHDGNAD
jgi:hypothetical protein